MRRILLFSIVAAAALAMGMGMGGAIAQEDASNETENGTVQYEAEFDDDLRILEYELEDGTARITFDADRPRRATITDAMDGIGSDGIVEPHSREYDVSRGETTIEMDVTQVRGASAVGVSVGGTTARLTSDFEEQEPHDPLQYFGGLSGLFTGIFMSVGLFGGSAWYVVRREESGVIEA